jgi:hypothetical protein
MTEPDQVAARQARPVAQEVENACAISHHAVLQSELWQVVAERTLPFKETVVDRAADGRHREVLCGGDVAWRCFGEIPSTAPRP